MWTGNVHSVVENNKWRLPQREWEINSPESLCLIFQEEPTVEVEMGADNSEEKIEETDMPLQIHISNVRPKPGITYELFVKNTFFLASIWKVLEMTGVVVDLESFEKLTRGRLS